jgi:F-type H+-transporting ATPase subunit delta
VFHAERWACAFIGALDTDWTSPKAEAGLVCLKKLAAEFKPLAGVLFGRSISKAVEENLSKEFSLPEDDGGKSAYDVQHQYAIRFVCLLIEKNLFRKVDVIIARIEKILDDKNGVLDVLVETASREDKTFQDELSQMIMKNTGASKIKMSTKLVPELIAGYRLRMGGLSIDASLKGQLEQMTLDLIAVQRKM